MLVLNLMFFIFGIALTTGVVEFLATPETWSDPKNEQLLHYFGSLDRSMVSLYMAMSGGRDWAEYYDELNRVGGLYKLFFILFMSFALFAVVNIVTGIFVENAMQSNISDRDTILEHELEEKSRFLKSMQAIFEEMDENNSGCINIDEFERQLDDERVIAYFQALKLDASEARTLFKLLDLDESGEIEISEFMLGCERLKGESRSLDIAIIQYELRWLTNAFTGFAEHTERTLQTLAESAAISAGQLRPNKPSLALGSLGRDRPEAMVDLE